LRDRQLKVILITLVIVLALFIVANNDFSDYLVNDDSNLEKDIENNLKTSGYWELSPIVINDSGGGDYTWVQAKTEDWCSGSGTWNNPYVIENVTINANKADKCLAIIDSNAYFIVQNCTFYNSSQEGILLNNATNGQLINNNCSLNYLGISTEYSNNNTVSGNTANNNIYCGIYLSSSHNNTISKNNITEGGIYLLNSDIATVIGNILNDCGVTIDGSLESLSSIRIDTTNYVNGNPLYCYINETALGMSNFSNPGQIILINCNDSLISNFNVSYTQYGISAFYCNNNTISDNNISHNTYGIYLYFSDNNIVSGNTVNDNNCDGIDLFYSHNNTVSGNTVNDNNCDGIDLSYSHNNTVSGNTASYNGEEGIRLYWSDNNNVSGNTASYNGEEGIRLYFNYNNIVSGNTVNNNIFYGIYLYYSHNNTISKNNITKGGIYLLNSGIATVIGNILNGCGVKIDGSLESLSSIRIDTTNYVNGNPLYCYINEAALGTSNFSNPGQIILINCNDSLISNFNISYASNGISAFYCNNNTISDNNASHNTYGIHLYYSHNNTVSGNTVNNNAYGIYLWKSDKATVSGNTVNDNNCDGIDLSYSHNNTVSGNTANDNNRYGIILYYSNNNIVLGNTANDNTDYGINLNRSYYQTVSGNTVSNNTCGIYLISSHHNDISGNNANDNTALGMYLVFSNNNPISNNNASHNIHGIYLSSSYNNFISENNATNSYFGMYLKSCHNSTILKNSITKGGINLFNSNITTVIGNIFNDCGVTLGGSLESLSSIRIDTTNYVNGNPLYCYINETALGMNNFSNPGQIILINCNDSLISNYNISYASYGISTFYCYNNNISDNYVSHNIYGLYLSSSYNNTISGNTVNNNRYGIRIFYSHKNDISGNTVNKNTYIGIMLHSSLNNTVSGNIINDTNDYGISILINSKGNLIIKNYFIGNGINARDEGINNQWDNGVIGNYWDDYNGVDANDDSIGDTPYNIGGSAGSQDNFPIWDDGPGPTLFPPTNPFIIINNGDAITNSTLVTLTLSAEGAEEMCFRNGTTGTWTDLDPYNTTKQLYLVGSTNNTEYTICVKFQNTKGESEVVCDSILYLIKGEEEEEEEEEEEGEEELLPIIPGYPIEWIMILLIVFISIILTLNKLKSFDAEKIVI